MNRFCTICTLLAIACTTSFAQDEANLRHPDNPDTHVQAGVPQGEVMHFTFDKSTIYPGTVREYWVYVPAQYEPSRPACLFLDFDGIQFNAPVVFDNLINKQEMPVTIGVFVGPGTVYDHSGFPIRHNRSFEFDSTNDDFIRFIETELLPDVESKTTSDGRAIKISHSGNDRAIAGCSSGGIGAFTAAWQRPDLFSRVYSCIGTFVGMRGGDSYPVLIRKTEPKPLRIFLQDGEADTWNPIFGNWYNSNIDMEAALSFAGYEVGHAWGKGGHDGIHGTMIFPDVMRWLWRGWPQPVGKGLSGNDMLQEILIPQEEWTAIDSAHKTITAIAADKQGNIYYYDAGSKSIYTLKNSDEDNTATFIRNAEECSALMATHDCILTLFTGKQGVSTYDAAGKKSRIYKRHSPHAIYVSNNNDVYMALPDGGITLMHANAEAVNVAENSCPTSAFAMSPDHKLLFACDTVSHWIRSYAIGSDGELLFGQRYYWLHVAESNDGLPNRSGASAMALDRNGNLYVATKMGVQVADRNGRVRAILTLPQGAVSTLCFGGHDFKYLYIVCDGKLYRRKMKVPGTHPLAAPIEMSAGDAG